MLLLCIVVPSATCLLPRVRQAFATTTTIDKTGARFQAPQWSADGTRLVYATGAEIQFADREVVEQLVAQSRGQNYGFRSLLHAVVQSRVFLSK